jgi:hypothetical protein
MHAFFFFLFLIILFIEKDFYIHICILGTLVELCKNFYTSNYKPYKTTVVLPKQSFKRSFKFQFIVRRTKNLYSIKCHMLIKTFKDISKETRASCKLYRSIKAKKGQIQG